MIFQVFCWMKSSISRVFILRQLWIVNYHVKSSSNNLSNENINSSFEFTFCLEDKRNTSVNVFISEIISLTFDVIIDDKSNVFEQKNYCIAKFDCILKHHSWHQDTLHLKLIRYLQHQHYSAKSLQILIDFFITPINVTCLNTQNTSNLFNNIELEVKT